MLTVERVLAVLCAGRSCKAVLTRLAVASIVAAILWLSAGAFMLLEPVA